VKIRFLTLAAQEVDEAFVWFEEQFEGKESASLTIWTALYDLFVPIP
jgi:hypothetical protein